MAKGRIYSRIRRIKGKDVLFDARTLGGNEEVFVDHDNMDDLQNFYDHLTMNSTEAASDEEIVTNNVLDDSFSLDGSPVLLRRNSSIRKKPCVQDPNAFETVAPKMTKMPHSNELKIDDTNNPCQEENTNAPRRTVYSRIKHIDYNNTLFNRLIFNEDEEAVIEHHNIEDARKCCNDLGICITEPTVNIDRNDQSKIDSLDIDSKNVSSVIATGRVYSLIKRIDGEENVFDVLTWGENDYVGEGGNNIEHNHDSCNPQRPETSKVIKDHDITTKTVLSHSDKNGESFAVIDENCSPNILPTDVNSELSDILMDINSVITDSNDEIVNITDNKSPEDGNLYSSAAESTEKHVTWSTDHTDLNSNDMNTESNQRPSLTKRYTIKRLTWLASLSRKSSKNENLSVEEDPCWGNCRCMKLDNYKKLSNTTILSIGIFLLILLVIILVLVIMKTQNNDNKTSKF